jgi:thiamine-phosphate pyrophosphorylase
LNPAEIADSCLRAGADLFVLRARRTSDQELAAILRELYPLRSSGMRILVAPAPGTADGATWLRFCDGVHLTGSDGPTERPANRHAPFLLSRSAHLPEHQEHHADLNDQLDMQTISPVFKPSYKGATEPVDALGLDGLRRFVASSSVPAWALGGISTENIRAVMGTGVHGVAIMGPLHVPDPQQREDLMRSLIMQASPSLMN